MLYAQLHLKPSGHALTKHLTLEGDQAVFPALSLLLLTAQRTVPVEELKVALQYCPDLHLPLSRAAGVQEVNHHGQALQGQPWEPRTFGFRGGPAAPHSQNREQVLNRLTGDREKAILLEQNMDKMTPL